MRNVEARRMREDALKLQQANVRDMQKANLTALWEDNSIQKQRASDIMQKQRSMNAQHNDALLEKKQRLADLYNHEMQIWRREMNQLRSTSENKQEIMLERARELKEKRLREKRQLVEEKLLQQQRDACDDARVADTLKKGREIFDLRKEQLAEKENKLEEQRRYDARMAEQWSESKRLKDEQELAKEKEVQIRNREMKTMLDQQVSYRQRRQDEIKMDKKREVSELRSAWQFAEQQALDKEDKERKAALDRAAKVAKENSMQQKQIQEKKQREMEYDLRLLNMAISREKEQEQAEQNLKDAQKNEMREYQALLRAQMTIAAEDHSNMENLLRQEEARIRAVEDAKQKREQDARDHLRNEVMRTRKEQEDHKLKLKMHEKQIDMMEATKLNEQLDSLNQQEKAVAMKSALERKKYQNEIKNQMDTKSREQEQQKQQAFLQHKHALNAQRNYEERLQKLVSMPAQTQFKRKSAVWQFDS